MELDQLPDNILLNILINLDVSDSIRYSRVSQRWHDLCQLALETEIRTLDLSNKCYWRMNDQSLSSILQLCSRNLIKIILPSLKKSSHESNRYGSPSDSYGPKLDPISSNSYLKMTISRWCQTLANFRFPNLQMLDLGDAPTDKNCVKTILASNPALETLYWSTPDPNGIEFDSRQSDSYALRELDLGCLFATDILFTTLAQNCPNLERLTASAYFRQWTASGLDRLCGSCPNLKKLNLKANNSLKATGVYVVPILFDPPNLLTDLTHFWSLSQLRYLCLPFEGGLFDDQTLYRISICFPNLHTFHFADSRLSAEGVANLCRLKNLKCLTMAQCIGDIEHGLLQLAAEGRLRKLNLALTRVSPQALFGIIYSCPRLQLLNISKSVSNYQVHRGTNVTIPEAVDIVNIRWRVAQQMYPRSQCLTIVHTDPGVWTSPFVKKALEKANSYEMEIIRLVLLIDYSKMESDDENIFDDT